MTGGPGNVEVPAVFRELMRLPGLVFINLYLLALAAVFLLVVYNLWIFSTQHQGAALVQGLLNLVFFLYLVRPEVREKLR
jgi:hypothetical protein